MYLEYINQNLSKSIAAKQSTLEALPLYHSTVTYASVVKGKMTINTDEDNVSNMTESSNEKAKNRKIKSSKVQVKSNINQKDDQSIDD